MPERIARIYVVDSNVAFYGGAPPEAFAPHIQPLVQASTAFLSRATFHGAELHVPSVFLSETATLVYRELIVPGVLDLMDGKRVLEAIISTAWDLHFPVFDDVFDLQHALGRADTTTDAEFLALTADLNCEFITTDKVLAEEAKRSVITVPVRLVMDHPWGQPGALEDDPPTD
jgi:predicted nucleic acid-binding protein